MKNLLLSIFIFISITLLYAQDGVYDNVVYDKNIRTVEAKDVVSLGRGFVIDFDYMGEAPYMVAKIIHCNWDWTPSILLENEYFDGFNEFQLNDVEGSSASKNPYYHFRLETPRVKLSGNYIVHIFDEENPEINYLTRRFSVYTNEVILTGKRNLSAVVKNRYSGQQIDFSVFYGQYDLQDPYQNVHVVVRQNERWDNAKYKLKPSFIGVAEKKLTYNFFGGESTFPALREYRAFEFGRNRFRVENLVKENDGDKVYLREDIDRSLLNYVDDADENGQYYIESPYDGEYSFVHFSLKTSKRDSDVYVFGQLSDWKLKDEFKMEFDEEDKKYKAVILLKQGEYNYSYALDESGSANETVLQGSHSETENDYEVLVYYRPFGKYYDEIVAFKAFK